MLKKSKSTKIISAILIQLDIKSKTTYIAQALKSIILKIKKNKKSAKKIFGHKIDKQID